MLNSTNLMGSHLNCKIVTMLMTTSNISVVFCQEINEILREKYN